MTKSKYGFERSELRALQNMCAGDNEEFLNQLANMIGKLTEERNQYKMEATLAHNELQILRDQLDD